MSTENSETPREKEISFEQEFALEMVGRQCRLEEYVRLDSIESFQVGGDFIAYSSPDSTYAVTRRLVSAARESILIGIYDFSAPYIQELLLEAMERGVRVSLMLDIDSDGEREVFDNLKEHGVECVPAPSCASDYVHYFASSHEKVIVIDDEWTLVQSGNYSKNSIPRNETDGGDPEDFRPGNRDMGVAIKSRPLARFFTEVLRSDMQLETEAEGQESAGGVEERIDFTADELLVEAPSRLPDQLFPSQRFNPPAAVTVTPVLTPDNYMDVIPDVLARARRYVYIEQQYIKRRQPNVRRLLEAIGQARADSPGLEVRIIVARPMARGDAYEREVGEIEALSEFGLEMGVNVRILNPRHFVHCHNKLIVIDGERVLVSSQNWSDFAVVKNREAGVLIEYPDIARYYAEIFESDWRTALESLRDETPPRLLPPKELNAGRRMVRLNWGDYVEV